MRSRGAQETEETAGDRREERGERRLDWTDSVEEVIENTDQMNKFSL